MLFNGINSLGNVNISVEINSGWDDDFISKSKFTNLSEDACAFLNNDFIVLPLKSQIQQCQKFSNLAVVRRLTSNLGLWCRQNGHLKA